MKKYYAVIPSNDVSYNKNNYNLWYSAWQEPRLITDKKPYYEDSCEILIEFFCDDINENDNVYYACHDILSGSVSIPFCITNSKDKTIKCLIDNIPNHELSTGVFINSIRFNVNNGNNNDAEDFYLT